MPRPAGMTRAELDDQRSSSDAPAVDHTGGVADRFGLWGPKGTPLVAWGDWSDFCAYTAQLDWFLPKGSICVMAWIATSAETLLGLALVVGLFLRPAALASAVLLTLFAIAMWAPSASQRLSTIQCFPLQVGRCSWEQFRAAQLNQNE